jgi:hypothetical protein
MGYTVTIASGDDDDALSSQRSDEWIFIQPLSYLSPAAGNFRALSDLLPNGKKWKKRLEGR